MFRTRAIALMTTVFLLAASGPLPAASSRPPASNIPNFLNEYQYQMALYSFLSDDNLAASSVSEEILKRGPYDKANILLRLSDGRLLYKRDYPEFASPSLFMEQAMATGLLDSYYRLREYDEIFAVGKPMADSAAARYFEGMALLGKNRLGEAHMSLSKVPAVDPLHPYAVIALAQADVMRQNYAEAEKRLEGLVSTDVAKPPPVNEKAHLMLAHLLFEKGLYADALNQFMHIPDSSRLYREALAGQAWCLVKLKDYEGAIPLLQNIKAAPPYDRVEQDAQILLGVCYIRLGLSKQITEHFHSLLNAFSAGEKSLDRLINDRAARKTYISILLDGNARPSGKEEQMYASYLGSDQGVITLVNAYGAIRTLRAGFASRRARTIELENYIINSNESLVGLSDVMDRNIKRTKELLLLMEKRREEKEKLRSVLRQNLPYFTVIEKNIFYRWKALLKREPTDETKRLVRIILQEWAEQDDMECLSSPVICHVINFLNSEAPKEKPEEIKEIVGILEMEGKDAVGVSTGGQTGFERTFEGIKARIRDKVDKNGRELKKLGGLRAELSNNIAQTQAAEDNVAAMLDRRIKGRFIKSRYELDGVMSDILSELNKAEKNMEKAQKKQ
ncbi:MAG: hypothetical protein HZB22_03885 [Deltaproteobacteria bacterium]|nr:hypothetical protein [Deltaproteobacteria bacterium]